MKKRKKYWYKFAALLFLFSILVSNFAFAAFPKDAIPVDFWLNWNVPRRWYTGLAMNFRVTWYEVDDRPVSFSLSNQPSGMTVGTDGVLSWPNPIAGTYSNVVLTVTRGSCNSTDYPGCSLTTSQTFTLAVSTDTTNEFGFVSNTGSNNASCGTLASPCSSLSYLIANRIPSGNNGITIYIRGGSFTDGWNNEVFVGKSFTATDPMVILPYPGETPVINISGAGNWGLGVRQETAYVDIAVPVFGNLGNSQGNYVLSGPNTIVHDVTTGGSRSSDNSAAVVVSGDNAIVDRVVSYDNWEPGKAHSPSTWNNANILAYNDVANKTSWVMNSKAYDSESCFKIKHTNCNVANGGSAAGSCNASTPSRTVFHNNEAAGACDFAFLGFGDYSSWRFGVSYKNLIGMDLQTTDPSTYTVGTTFVEHMTIIGKSTGNYNYGIGTSYGTTGPINHQRNISYQDGGSCCPGNPEGANCRKHYSFWIYTNPVSTAQAYNYFGDRNIFYNSTSNTDCFHFGSNNSLTFAGYQALTHANATRDPNSITLDPGMNSVSTGNLNITTASNAATSCGSGQFCGAFRPDKTYGTVGNQNTTLLEWYGVLGGGGGGGPAQSPDGAGYLAGAVSSKRVSR